jgi:hypothetical protein
VTTVLETPTQEKDRRIREKWDRRAQKERDRAEFAAKDPEVKARQREVSRRARTAPAKYVGATITWLDPPVAVGGLRIVGIASDASDDVKREYGIAV